MNAQPLFVSAQSQAAFTQVRPALCGVCRRVWESTDSANRCCICSYCGKENNWNRGTSHPECARAAIASTENEHLEVAEIVEYDGPFIYRDRYFDNKDELIEYMEGDDTTVPEFVFCARYVEPHLDLEEILQDLQENQMHEDWEPMDCEPLEAAVKAWNEANGANGTWFEDDTRKTRLREASA